MNQLWLLTTLLVVLLAMTVMSQDKAEVCNGKCKRLEKKCKRMTKFMSKNCVEKGKSLHIFRSVKYNGY